MPYKAPFKYTYLNLKVFKKIYRYFCLLNYLIISLNIFKYIEYISRLFIADYFDHTAILGLQNENDTMVDHRLNKLKICLF